MPPLTGAHQEDAARVHFLHGLKPCENCFHIRLLGKDCHFQRCAVALTAVSAAPEVKAVDDHAPPGQFFRIESAGMMASAVSVGENNCRPGAFCSHRAIEDAIDLLAIVVHRGFYRFVLVDWIKDYGF